MKISLLTPTYNSSKTLTDTLDSVIAQTENHPEIAEGLEYIIIDGGSSDGTQDIVKNFQSKYRSEYQSEYQNKYQSENPPINIRLISEPDKGIFDAMNKGVKMATGDIVGILNSDDFFYDKNVLSKVLLAFESNPEIDAVYGDLIYVDNDDIKKQTRYWKADPYKEENLNWGWSIPHPTFFVRRGVYEKIQKQDGRIFDTSFIITGCYELTFRLLKIHKIKVKYIPEILVTMRNGGTSANSFKQRLRGWKEQRLVWEINSIKIPHFFITRRILNKIGQFLHLYRKG